MNCFHCLYWLCVLEGKVSDVIIGFIICCIETTKKYYICCLKTTLMEQLFKYSQIKSRRTSLKFKRYLYDEIQWDDRLIGITGARGIGKTTLSNLS